MNNNNTSSSNRIALVAREYLVPFILITSLFFMWGGARAILDVLNKHFQLTFGINKAHSALMQSAIYGAYFLGAIPAGMFIKRWGTRRGVDGTDGFCHRITAIHSGELCDAV